MVDLPVEKFYGKTPLMKAAENNDVDAIHNIMAETECVNID